MPLNVSYSVNRADRMRFAAEFDRLSKPATFKQQQEWASANPDSHALKAQRIFNGLMSHRAIAEMPQYKFLRCRHIERKGSCPMEDRCNFVHTEAYKDALVCYKRVHGQNPRHSQPVGEKSPSPVSSSPASSPNPAEGVPSQEERPVSQPPVLTPELVFPAPSPIPAAVGTPLAEQPRHAGPRFGMPPVVIVDDAAILTKYVPRDILFGIDVDLSWLRRA